MGRDKEFIGFVRDRVNFARRSELFCIAGYSIFAVCTCRFMGKGRERCALLLA